MSSIRYGVPYKGSKNAIAEWVVSKLPEGECFVDLFAGGCAVTHAALLSGKWKSFICNDINDTPQLFIDAIHGKYTEQTQTEFITREMFHERKATDAYVRQCWSFGNNGVDYLYGAETEGYKKAYHTAVFFNDIEPLKEYGVELVLSDKPTPSLRYADYRQQIKILRRAASGSNIVLLQEAENLERLQSLESLESLERLESLESLERLESLQLDYAAVKIPDGAVIYCDIPYKSTLCGQYKGFDHDRFYKWALEQDNIFISEYMMPEDFVPIAEMEKSVLSSAFGTNSKKTERIFTNERTYERLDHEIYRIHRQTTIFDFLGG